MTLVSHWAFFDARKICWTKNQDKCDFQFSHYIGITKFSIYLSGTFVVYPPVRCKYLYQQLEWYSHFYKMFFFFFLTTYSSISFLDSFLAMITKKRHKFSRNTYPHLLCLSSFFWGTSNLVTTFHDPVVGHLLQPIYQAQYHNIYTWHHHIFCHPLFCTGSKNQQPPFVCQTEIWEASHFWMLQADHIPESCSYARIYQWR